MDTTPTLETLFRAHYAPLVSALSLTFGPEVAADAVADAFLALERKWRTVSRYDSPVAWLRRVATNKAIDAHRKRRRLVRLAGRERAALPVPTEALMDLKAAVDSMPTRMRLIFSLFYLADLSIADIAAALEISEGTVKSTLSAARQRAFQMEEL